MLTSINNLFHILKVDFSSTTTAYTYTLIISRMYILLHMIKITRINEKALEKLCYANLDQFSIASEQEGCEGRKSKGNAKSLHYPHTSMCYVMKTHRLKKEEEKIVVIGRKRCEINYKTDKLNSVKSDDVMFFFLILLL